MNNFVNKKSPDFVAYTEKKVLNRILTSWFRHTGFIPAEYALDVNRVEESNDEFLRIEGELVEDRTDGSENLKERSSDG